MEKILLTWCDGRSIKSWRQISGHMEEDKTYNAEFVSVPSAASRSKETSASKSDEPLTASRNEETSAASSSDEPSTASKSNEPWLQDARKRHFLFLDLQLQVSANSSSMNLYLLSQLHRDQHYTYQKLAQLFPSSTSEHHLSLQCGQHLRQRLQRATRTCLCSLSSLQIEQKSGRHPRKDQAAIEGC